MQTVIVEDIRLQILNLNNTGKDLEEYFLSKTEREALV